MTREEFKHAVNNNVLSNNTRKISLSNDHKEIQLNVVKYDLVAEGFRLTIENSNKKDIYDYLNNNYVFFKPITLGIHNSVILVTEFDYINHL